MTSPTKPQAQAVTIEKEAPLSPVLQAIITETENLRKDITPFAAELEAASPRKYSAERILAGLDAAVAKDPKILKADRKSLYLALMKVARWALDIGDGVDLVCINNKVKGENGQPDTWKVTVEAWPDYKGLKALAIREGLMLSAEEYVVYEGEHFLHEEGLRQKLEHSPRAGGTNRKVIAFYTRIRLRGGEATANVMYFDAVEERRAKSKSWSDAALAKKKQKTGCPPWYGKKTAIRDWLNRQPKTGVMSEALHALDRDEVREALDLPDEPIIPLQVPPGTQPPAGVTTDGEVTTASTSTGSGATEDDQDDLPF